MDDDAIRDLFSSLGRVTIRRMFGGKGVYRDGLIFAIEMDGDVLLKADALSAPDFAEAGSSRWVYEGHARRGAVAMPYWSIPDSALDDPDEMALWARRAHEAALRAPRSKNRKS